MKIQFNPRSLLAEIGWRWTFGLGALILAGAGYLRVAVAVTLSDADLAALRSRNWLLISSALLRLGQDVGPGMLRASLIVIPAVLVLWIAAATFGRLRVLELLLPGCAGKRSAFAGVLAANLLRAVGAVAALALCLLTLVMASFISMRFSPHHDEPNLAAYFLMAAVALPIELALWAAANWFFSLTPIFSVREGQGLLAAAKLVIRWVRQHRAELFSASSYYGFWRLVALLATLALTAGIGSATALIAGPRTVLAVVIALSLAYFAVADWLYVARLAAYAALVDEVPEVIAGHPEKNLFATDVGG